MKFKPKKTFCAIQRYINKMCKIKCGKVPLKKTDCIDASKDDYRCRIKLISDNTMFHFKKGWIRFLVKDLKELIKIKNNNEF
jgi:hypothetical protein